MNTQPEACKHEHIQTWRFEDSQEPAMWSCVACAAKFEPIKGWMDQIERKDALLRQALEALENSVDDVQQAYDNDWRHGMPTREKQLTSLKELLDAHKVAIELIRKELQ